MKVLLLVPKRYSIYQSFVDIFGLMNAEISNIDYFSIVSKLEKRIHAQTYRMPDKWRLKWESHYFKKINEYYIQEFNRIKPDVTFIYNDEMLLPETVQHFKQKGSKIAFFLGDNPLYTHSNRYFIALLFLADAAFAPDSFWVYQIQKMGVKNIYYCQTDVPQNEYFIKKLDHETYEVLKSEVLYVGMSYPNSWGYKKARFLNEFTGYDLKIYGDKHWKKFFRFFPKLEQHFTERTGYISLERMNDMYNATKIIPVDANPGLLNGLHVRMWEALGAGALPILEWQHDLIEIFGEHADLPAVKSFAEIPEMTRFYLENEEERTEKVNWMVRTIHEKYSNEKVMELIKDTLNIN